MESLPRRVFGIIRHPRSTLARIVTAPSWFPVLVLTFVVISALLLWFSATEVGRQAFLDQWERTRVAFGQPLDDAEYARMDTRSAALAPLYAIGVALSSLLLPIIVAGATRLLLKPSAGTSPDFAVVLAVLAHANVILALRQLVATPVAFVRESLASSTTLIQFVPSLDETSLLARFFGGVDLFMVWWIVVASIGLGLAYRRPARHLAVLLIATYVALAAAVAAGIAAMGGAA